MLMLLGSWSTIITPRIEPLWLRTTVHNSTTVWNMAATFGAMRTLKSCYQAPREQPKNACFCAKNTAANSVIV